MTVIVTILILLSLLVGFFGFSNLTVATQGVGLLAAAVLLAILARIAQAAGHHYELKSLLRRREQDTVADQ